MACNEQWRRPQPWAGELRRWLLCGLLGLLGCTQTRPNPEELVVLLPREPLEVDPRFAADAYSLKVTRLLFASLITIDPQTLEPTPDLAERVVRETSTRVRVQLKPGLRFSDGSALDSADVAATFRSILSESLGSRYISTYRRIARIEIHDPLSLSFHLDGPHATFVTDLEMPVLRAEDAARPVGREQPPVGSGPYRLVERARGDLLLRGNQYYHGPSPRFDPVRLRVVRDDNIRALRMLTGAGDLAVDAVPGLLLPLFKDKPAFSIERAPGVGTTYLGVNTQAPALRDVRVRKALAYAIDRQRIVAAKLGGRARLARSFVPPGHWAYAPDTPSYPYAPARARALLAKAGLRRPLRLALRTTSDRARLSLARVLAAMFSDVGIEVTVQTSETATLLSNLSRGRFELTLLQMPELVEPHVLSWFFGSARIPGPHNEGANRWRLRNPELDRALEWGRRESEPAERRAAYHRVQRILAQELPVVPLWHDDVVAVIGARGAGFTVARHGRFDGLFR